MCVRKWFLVCLLPLFLLAEETKNKLSPQPTKKPIRTVREVPPLLMESVSQDGKVIRLHDGRKYLVMPGEEWISQGWMAPVYPGSDPRPVPMMLKENPDKDTKEMREYPYIIVNLRMKQYVYAKVWVNKVHRQAMAQHQSEEDEEYEDEI